MVLLIKGFLVYIVATMVVVVLIEVLVFVNTGNACQVIIPRRVCQRMEKIWRRIFLLEGCSLERSLTYWNAVCMDTKQGGMGIRSLSILNKALLGFGGSMKREGKGMGVGLWKTIKKDGKCFKLEPAL